MNSWAVRKHRHRQPLAQQKSLRGWWRRCRRARTASSRLIGLRFSKVDDACQQVHCEPTEAPALACLKWATSVEKRHEAPISRFFGKPRIALCAEFDDAVEHFARHHQSCRIMRSVDIDQSCVWLKRTFKCRCETLTGRTTCCSITICP